MRVAVERGELEAARLASYHKLESEMDLLSRRQDKVLSAAQKQKVKVLQKAYRARPDKRKPR